MTRDTSAAEQTHQAQQAGRSKQAQHAQHAYWTQHAPQEQQAGSSSQGNYLRLPIASSKADKHSLEHQLPAALEFVSGHLAQHHRVLITCDTGKDSYLLACHEAEILLLMLVWCASGSCS